MLFLLLLLYRSCAGTLLCFHTYKNINILFVFFCLFFSFLFCKMYPFAKHVYDVVFFSSFFKKKRRNSTYFHVQRDISRARSRSVFVWANIAIASAAYWLSEILHTIVNWKIFFERVICFYMFDMFKTLIMFMLYGLATAIWIKNKHKIFICICCLVRKWNVSTLYYLPLCWMYASLSCLVASFISF